MGSHFPSTVANERRRFARFALTGELPGVLTNNEGEILDVIPVDVSVRGLGLLLDPGPEPGESLTLAVDVMGQPLALALKVCWNAMDQEITSTLPDIGTMRRCGLELMTEGVDLVDVLAGFESLQIEE